MLEQLSSGQTDPRLLASLAKGRLREKRTELEAALLGRIEPHHRLLIIELLAHVDYLDESIERLSAEIGDRLRPFDEDQRLVDTIPGVNTKTAQVLLAEAGTDISRFPTDRHLSSWAGATTTLRLNFDFEHVHHTFADVIGGGWLIAHQPDGEWLYGADISVRQLHQRSRFRQLRRPAGSSSKQVRPLAQPFRMLAGHVQSVMLAGGTRPPAPPAGKIAFFTDAPSRLS